MKTLKAILLLFAAMAIVTACDPMEDESLRDKYITNAGDPISKEELNNILSVTQPIPNQDDAVEGDQYVVIKNNRPELGGIWHYGVGTKITGSDNDTIIYGANGTYEIYYEALSNGKIVTSDIFTVTVTNVFDEWMGLFTGAKDKTDADATKAWGFREVKWGSVCNMGAHGGWKYTSAGYTPESNFAWWGSANLAQAGDQRIVFEIQDTKLKTYDKSGKLVNEGTFNFDHEQPEELVQGRLTTNIPVIGSNYDDLGQSKGKNNVFWILTLTDEYITLYHPQKYTGGGDWDDYGWYVYYESKE